MEFLGVEQFADRLCGELSKGNQQKVQLVAAVVHAPELLVLDEPFSGLDPVNAEMILAAVRLLSERGTTLVLSSHQMFQIENACHKFCVVGDGRVLAEGTLAELRAAFPTRQVHVEPDTPAVREVLARFGAGEPHRNGAGLVYELAATTDFGALLREAVAAGSIETFEKREPTLGEIYLRSLDGSA
jgi:ABC-2 type transport system ATP-binding protein